ncbi:MAG: hypothetical protein JO152_12170 [Mycobacteriaceae bacterium]|nr:hypothetical protein [Mycobacteriaceae bacterium]
MNTMDTGVPARGGRLHMRRSIGAASGFLLILLGVWGALVPFIGPYFDFAYTPDVAWTWTAARGWLEVLPGAATVLGGLILLGSGNRASAMFGGWLTVVAGAWFVIGNLFAGPLRIGAIGDPIAATDTKRAFLELTYFFGLGALIVFLGAAALGRVSVRSVRDHAYAQRPVTAAAANYQQPQPDEANADETPTTVEPAGAHRTTDGEREHRSWRDLFSRRHPTAANR